MRAGLFLACWPWFSPEEQIELAVLADELGLDSARVSEAWGQEAVSVLGLLAEAIGG
jgi:alkanesulfonate monooxygenase SsuD/methylene tetrahydromethanopterin reductase-like flavin-dependent oxidoreductase (luciferase family)